MAEHISINGKNYVPSNSLAGSFGYSSDYIGKLAREEKVLGLQVGRQWFVEPTSLEVYLQKVTIEKEIVKDELRATRKRERSVHELQTPLSPIVHSSFALAQTVAIVLCGFFVGGLGYVAQSNNISTAHISAGAKDTFTYVALALAPKFGGQLQSNVVSAPEYETQTVTETKPQTQPIEVAKKEIVFTKLPILATASTTAQASVAKIADASQLTFSDEITVSVDAKGVSYVEPVFGHKASSSAHFVLLSPEVNAKRN